MPKKEGVSNHFIQHYLSKEFPPLLVFLFLMILVISASAQVKGRVTDAETGQPLPFVHIVAGETTTGTMTDIDGYFSFSVPSGTTFLKLSYVGYFSRIHPVEFSKELHEITMHSRPFELREVVVYSGENPAHRIVRNAIANRSVNDPEKLNAFTYNSYNKFLATLDREFYMERFMATGDTTFIRMVDILDSRHVFIMESVTERLFRAPGLNHETVIANRVSGLKNPTFTMLATELQPFSFYGKSIVLLEGEYLSPLNESAFNRYSYSLEDTLLLNNDSIFVISYKPGQNTNFDGLEGLMYINTHKWALQNVIAEPARQIMGRLHFRIQQKYELQDSTFWFPVQLNTEVDFFSPESGNPTSMFPAKMIGRSYIRNIAINPELRRNEFAPFDMDFSPQANTHNDTFWQQYRPEPLSKQEINTYHFMDSVGTVQDFDRLFNSLEPLFFGEIPFGILSIPVNSIYRFNSFERHRLGLALHTNRGLSQRVKLGGHYAWGSGDREEKYGYFGEIVLSKKYDLRVGGAFHKDVSERGGSELMQQSFLLSPSLVRNLYMDKMDYTQASRGYLSFLSFRNALMTELSLSRGKTWWTDQYYFIPKEGQNGVRSYRFFEARLRMRLAWGETLMKTPARIIRLPSDLPVFYLTVTRGFDNIYQGEFDFVKAEAALEMSYSIPLLGEQTWIAEAGWINRDNLPWPMLFTAKAGSRNYFLASPFSFGTMHMNEFVAHQFVSLFFQHSFKNLLFRRPGYEPELVIITNVGVGKLKNPQSHLFMNATSWEKGYFESGFAINSILPKKWVRRVIFGMSPGVEVLFRYGPYALPESRSNITVKLNMITAF